MVDSTPTSANVSAGAGAVAAAAGAEVLALADQLTNVDLSGQTAKKDDKSSNLSRRGTHGADLFQLPDGLLAMLRNMYDPETNPDGIINAGIADNLLCRTELLEYFLTKDRFKLTPADMTYADRFTTSTRLLEALAKLFNAYQPDWPDSTQSPLPIKKVEPDHIAIASGATGILDELFWNLCDEGDGVLLSAPYYNAFDNDLTNRAKAQIVQVDLPLPQLGAGKDKLGESLALSTFAKETVAAYEAAYTRAKQAGINVRALLLCNPHNPTGTIYPRSTVVALTQLAAKYKLHFVSDEIYARSCFPTSEVPQPARFESILSIDVANECGLDPSYVHVVTSASKDFAVNGFRLGVLVSQHNAALQRAMSSVGLLSQAASPATTLWATWLHDENFLGWYLAENRRRLKIAYEYVLEWVKHWHIPYYPSNSGFFLMLDLGKYAGVQEGMNEKEAREKEIKFVDRLIEEKILISPGGQYHHPKAGWFRFTFTMQPKTLKLALKRTERAMGVRDQDSFADTRKEMDLSKGSKPAPGCVTA